MGFGAEINDVINNLCSKLGVTANYLVPKLAEYKAITSAYMTGVWFIISVLGFVISFATKGKDDDGQLKYIFEEWRATLFLILFIASFFFLGAALACGYEFIGWKFSPEAKTIEYIMELIRQ